jgi:hypothetical protein
MKFSANDKCSYDIDVVVRVDGTAEPAIASSNTVHLHDQFYHYLSDAGAAVDASNGGHVIGEAHAW